MKSNPSTTTPDLARMCIELKDIVDLRSLKECIPHFTDDIGIVRNKRRFFQFWLFLNPKLTWNNIIDTLIKAGEYKLAIKVDAKFPYSKLKVSSKDIH